MAADAYLERLRHELAHPPFHSVLAPEAVSADGENGIVVIRLPFAPVLRRSPDADHYHGGVIATLIDLAAHASVAVQLGRMTPTVDLRVDYLRPAPGTDLLATARTLMVGRSLARADVEVRPAAGGKLLAVGRGTFSTLA